MATKWFWKNRLKENDIFSTTLCVYLVARIFGYLPFSIKFRKRNKLGRVEVRLFDKLWFVTAISIRLIFVCYTKGLIAATNHYTHFEDFLYQSVHTAGILMECFTITFEMFNRNEIWSIVVAINEFDEEVVIRFVLIDNLNEL